MCKLQSAQVSLHYEEPHFIARCSFQNRSIPKTAGFFWSDIRKCWYTREIRIAFKLRDYADKSAKKQFTASLISVSPWLGGIRYPASCDPMPFQITSVEWALSRNRSYLALDPGLGKTIVAAMIVATLGDAFEYWYVCPPFLKADVQTKFETWAPKSKITLIADTRFNGFDQKPKKPVCLFVDEAHRFKTLDAARTKNLFEKIFPQAEKAIFLSGTPMPNRPIELFPVLHHAAPETIGFKNRFEYGLRYCAAFQGAWGWDFSGASNMSELAENVKKTFMLRMRKKDVLKELPEKLEEMVVLDRKLPKLVADLEFAMLKKYTPDDLMKHEIGDEHIATYRRKLGEAKAKLAISYLENLLESDDASVLVFAVHTAVIASLAEGLKAYKPTVITGNVATGKRQALVDAFQKSGRLFIGNIQAAGVGFTLTKATRVVFVEYSWVPAENEQASDRAHRIGQERDVLVQYLVFKNSIDGKMMATILRKRNVINHV